MTPEQRTKIDLKLNSHKNSIGKRNSKLSESRYNEQRSDDCSDDYEFNQNQSAENTKDLNFTEMVRDSIEVQNSVDNYEYTLSNKPYAIDFPIGKADLHSPQKD